MPDYNQLAICTKVALKSTLAHSRLGQPQGIILSIPSTQGQLQNGINSQGKQHCLIHCLYLKTQFQTFINTSLAVLLLFFRAVYNA